ncbi:MAG: VTC domain-containing protein, partial [Acetatifactor sp.]|nr:VTC domain-containing protein [Acetatifactor sp.]
MPKYRHELKFLCPEQELHLIEMKVRQLCMPDAHADESGIYYIRSAYFDSLEDECLSDNYDGVDD